MNLELRDRCVLLTGAAGHLGKAVAGAFGEAGARLVLVDLHAKALEAAFTASPTTALVAANLLDAEGTQRAVAQAVERFGKIDVLCHLAGGFRMGETVHETSPATWDFLFDINGRTLVNIARAVVPQMIRQGGGKIVTVGANAAQKGAAQMGAYCAAKSGVIRLSEAMSAELKEQNINVNCVLPTIIDTPDNRSAMPDTDPARWVAPRALADVILFLSSDAARAVHGAAIPVAGLS